MSVKDGARFLGGFALALLMLWWVVRQVELGAVWRELQRVSISGVVVGALLVLASNIPRTWRWRALLEPVREGVGFGPLLIALTLGQAVSAAFPGRLGELVRPALLSGRERLPLAPCLGSVVTDRLLDGLTILALFATAVQLSDLEGASGHVTGLVKGASLGLVAASLATLALLLGISATRTRLELWLASRSGWRAWAVRSMLGFSRGVEALKHPRLLGRLVLHSLVVWTLIGGGTWIAIRACGAAVTPLTVLVILPLLVLGIALPTPGGAGGYHAAMMFGLTLFGVAEPVAVTSSLIVHVAVALPVLVLGGVFLAVDRTLLSDLLRVVRRVRSREAAPGL